MLYSFYWSRLLRLCLAVLTASKSRLLLSPHFNNMGENAEKPMDSDDCPYELWDERVDYAGQWIVAKSVNFRRKGHGSQEHGVWQSFHRPKKIDAKDQLEGVSIIGVLKRGDRKFFILVKQYRIASRKWIIEFPAGMLDPKESPIDAGLRELLEETGYHCSRSDVISCSSGRQVLDPSMSDDAVQYLHVEIDGNAEANLSPKQQLMDDEHIEVLEVECSQLFAFLTEYCSTRSDTVVEASLHTFAMGLSMAGRFS